MKVVFNNGVEAPVSNVSSVYSLVIPTVDKTEIANFQALLTSENLKSVKIVNEDNEVAAEAENMIFQGISEPNPGDDETTETNFMLRPMTDAEIQIAALTEEKELQAEAITELANIIAEM